MRWKAEIKEMNFLKKSLKNIIFSWRKKIPKKIGFFSTNIFFGFVLKKYFLEKSKILEKMKNRKFEKKSLTGFPLENLDFFIFFIFLFFFQNETYFLKMEKM